MDREDMLAKIALETLHVETLKTRMSDDLDFYQISVWNIKAALEKAYEAGKNSVEEDLKNALSN